jgi:hypothetical protein
MKKNIIATLLTVFILCFCYAISNYPMILLYMVYVLGLLGLWVAVRAFLD